MSGNGAKAIPAIKPKQIRHSVHIATGILFTSSDGNRMVEHLVHIAEKCTLAMHTL
jgi:hypothetical protein